jgi:ApaG protein
MYSKITHDIKVTVTPIFIGDQSRPNTSNYVWAYHIIIENKGTEIVQLLDRTWHITDSTGGIQNVEGPGVVGYQPLIRPNEYFEYTSGVNLATDSGFMEGKYRFQNLDAKTFDVDIPVFPLDIPNKDVVIN